VSNRFEGKKALVTGAASGIGRAVAARLAEEGARVACIDRNRDGAEATAAALGGGAVARGCDVSDAAAVANAVGASIDELGGLDVLCNAAGVGRFEHFGDVTVEGWREVLSINLDGTFYVTHAAMPALLDVPGAIVNVASLAGLRGQAYSTSYCVSKAGIVSLTKCLAVEYAKQGLRVNCVCPGGVRTPFLANFAPPAEADPQLLARLNLVPRLPEPEEVAATIAWLASDDADSMNGVALPMDYGTIAG
jgi:NAD(P)-dependent dehydrogenase (short-subunit alcohol dehydrogenase family)